MIVGGTGFLGGAIADAVVAAGHETTVLSRGNAARNTAPGDEAIRADRHGDLGLISSRDFDWIFDSCACSPDAVNRPLEVGLTARQEALLLS